MKHCGNLVHFLVLALLHKRQFTGDVTFYEFIFLYGTLSFLSSTISQVCRKDLCELAGLLPQSSKRIISKETPVSKVLESEGGREEVMVGSLNSRFLRLLWCFLLVLADLHCQEKKWTDGIQWMPFDSLLHIYREVDSALLFHSVCVVVFLM